MVSINLLIEGGEGPNTSLTGLLFIGIAFFFLVIIVGWWTSSKKQDQPEAKHDAVKSKIKKDADDLEKIEGIGPKVAKVLKEAGITTFDGLANAKTDDVQNILNTADLEMLNPEGWIAQAKFAAKGDWKAFEKLQAELKGGRKVK